uniref:Uncharacterized protein n=1 Tax=Avena sativa TaxID=4498 RepID=A0ACD5W583_AVESA
MRASISAFVLFSLSYVQFNSAINEAPPTRSFLKTTLLPSVSSNTDTNSRCLSARRSLLRCRRCEEDNCKMMSGNGHLQAPARRSGFTDRYMPMNRPAPASAVRDFAPDPKPKVRTGGRPLDGGTVYLELTPEQHAYGKRFGYAYINNPGPAAEVADPKALVRSAILAAAPELEFEVLGCSPIMADVCLRFATPEDRETAIARQPFELDSVSVEVVREGEQRNVRRVTLRHLAHIAFLDYPAEERTEEGIRSNCSQIGAVVEIDPGCFTAPDLAQVHLVVQLKDPGSIPAGLRLRYVDTTRTVCPVEVAQSFIPIQVVRVWEDQGRYTSLFNPTAGA